MRTSMLALIAISTIACKPPPQAPDDLEELCKYIFANMGEETVDEPAELLAGLTNLDTWLFTEDNLASTIEGYQIENLDEEAIANLDGQDRTIRETLIGAAVSHRHSSSMEDLMRAMFVVDWNDIAEGTYLSYDRQFVEDPNCLVDRSCLWNQYQTTSVSSWINLIEVVATNIGQMQWVETEYGWAMVQRTWLVEQGTVTPDSFGIVLYAQYFINVTAPTRDGDITRTTATWIDTDYGSIPVSEDFAKSQVVKSMQEQNEQIAEWIESQ